MRQTRVAGVLAAFAALMPVAADAQWSDLGLSGREVTALRAGHGLLYACSSDGVYRKASDTPDSTWTLLGFAGQRVHDILAVSAETLLVAREVTGTGADTVALHRSTDAGATWIPFQNGIGAGGTSWERKVVALLEPPGAPGTVLAASWSGIRKSTDGGLTWTTVLPSSRNFFLASGTSTLWVGGESGALTPFARRSIDGGDNWITSFWSGDDARATAMAFDPSNPNVAYLGVSYGLQRTTDNGVSWSPVPLPVGVGAGILGARAFPPLRLYALGEAPAGGATLFRSDDSAATWTSVSFPGASSSQEQALLVRSGMAADTVFLGMVSGVLRYVEQETVGAGPPASSHRLQLRVHPNPLVTRTTLTFFLFRASHVSLQVLDSSGRAGGTVLARRLGTGDHHVGWNPAGLRSGTYFVHLRAGHDVATEKLHILR